MKTITAAFLALILLVSADVAAVNPPALQWAYSSSPTTDPDASDWLFSVIQTSDGGYLASGWASQDRGQGMNLQASLLKLDANRSMQWHKILPPTSPGDGNWMRDAIETKTSYVAVGDFDGALRILEINKADGSLLTPPYIFTPQFLGLGTAGVDGYAIHNIVDGNGVDQGYILVGATSNTSYLLRLDTKFKPMTFNGNANGVVLIRPIGSTSTSSETFCQKVRVIQNSSGALSGFVTVGRIPKTPGGEIYDMFIETFNAQGAPLAAQQLTVPNLALDSPPLIVPAPLCPGVTSLATGSSAAFDVAVVPAGTGVDFVVSAQVNLFATYGESGCPNARLNGRGYTDLTAVLVKFSSALVQLWARPIGRLSGIDFETPILATSDGGFVVVGNDAVPSSKHPKDTVRTRVIKTNMSGQVDWIGDYLKAGDTNDCPFAVAKTFEDGIVIAGNNEKESDNYVILKLDPLTDLWMKDIPSDNGDEPNVSGADMWLSEDIWVRQEEDFFPYQYLHQHENPRYRNPMLGRPNYVYVEVRNNGTEPASGTLSVHFAKGSTGLGWPVDWQPQTTCCGKPCAGVLPPVSVTNLPPGQTEVVKMEWYPPNPADFAGGQCGPVAEQGHFCLLARIETQSASPFGMTFPEGAFVWPNTANNNNIVWKNVTILEHLPGEGKKGFGLIRNTLNTAAPIALVFEAPESQYGTLFDYATVEITLSPELIRSWRNGGSIGSQIERIDDTTIRLLGNAARMENITMQPRQFERFALKITPRVGPRGLQPEPMGLDVKQATSQGGSLTTVGGMRFTLEAPPRTRRRAVRH